MNMVKILFKFIIALYNLSLVIAKPILNLGVGLIAKVLKKDENWKTNKYNEIEKLLNKFSVK